MPAGGVVVHSASSWEGVLGWLVAGKKEEAWGWTDLGDALLGGHFDAVFSFLPL